MCQWETPRIMPFEQIVMVRTIKKQPDIFTESEWSEIKKEHYIHELGYVSNLSLDYEKIIASGLASVRESADEYGKRVIDALFYLCDGYLETAREQGRSDIVKILTRVPRYGAENFHEALQMFRILHYGFLGDLLFLIK